MNAISCGYAWLHSVECTLPNASPRCRQDHKCMDVHVGSSRERKDSSQQLGSLMLDISEGLACLQRTNELPEMENFISILQKCKEVKHASYAQQVHMHACDNGLELVGAVGDYLVCMFTECGSLSSAQQLFNRSVRLDELSWTSLIQGFIKHGEWEQALIIFHHMQVDVEHRRCSIIVLLKACASLKRVEKGREIHIELTKEGHDKELFIGTALVDMYAKCGLLAEAQEVFNQLPERDVVSWTALIGGYVDQGCGQEALKYLDCMNLEGVPMNTVTFLWGLKACGSLGAIDRGQEMHTRIATEGLEENPYIYSTLVDMYAEFGMFAEAWKLMNKLPDRHVVSWNALIMGYLKYGHDEEALNCLEQMQTEGVLLNAVTLVCSLKACTRVGTIEKGQEIHSVVIKEGFECDMFIGSALVDMYSQCGLLVEAQEVFGMLPAQDVVTWTALIGGFAEHGLGQEALRCYDQMKRDGFSPNGVTIVCALKACGIIAAIDRGRELHFEIAKEAFEQDPFVGNTLVDMYVKCGLFTEALEVFKELPVRNVVTWNALIAGYTEHGYSEDALSCLEQMEGDALLPDTVTFLSCLKACGSLGAIEKGREVHTNIVKEGFEREPFVFHTQGVATITIRDNDCAQVHGSTGSEALKLSLGNALIDMYCKCGSMVEAQHLFDAMSSRDLLTWSGLITGYARQGESELVFNLFERMRAAGVKPDGIAFLSVLTVCSHVGLLDKGQKYYETMNKLYGILPTLEHQNCMVDLVGRAGRLDEAVIMLDRMPFQPDLVTWSTLLGACSRLGDINLAMETFNCAMGLNEASAAWFILMSNIYADGYIWDD